MKKFVRLLCLSLVAMVSLASFGATNRSGEAPQGSDIASVTVLDAESTSLYEDLAAAIAAAKEIAAGDWTDFIEECLDALRVLIAKAEKIYEEATAGDDEVAAMIAALAEASVLVELDNIYVLFGAYEAKIDEMKASDELGQYTEYQKKKVEELLDSVLEVLADVEEGNISAIEAKVLCLEYFSEIDLIIDSATGYDKFPIFLHRSSELLPGQGTSKIEKAYPVLEGAYVKDYPDSRYGGSNVATYDSPLFRFRYPLTKVRFIVHESGADFSTDANGHAYFCLSEFSMYDEFNNKIELTTENFVTNANEPREGGGIPALIDGDYNTFFISMWSAGAPQEHYLEVTLPEGEYSAFRFTMVALSNRHSRLFPAEMEITSEGNNNDTTDHTLTYMVDGEVYYTESLPYGASITAPEPPTKEGYTFKGWSGLPQTMPAKNIVVTGIFEANKYQVTYIVDGEVYHTDSVAHGTVIKLPKTPKKEGYSFKGWNGLPETMPERDIVVTGEFVKTGFADIPVKAGEWLFDDPNDLYLCTEGNIKLVPYKVGENNTAPTAFEEGEATGIEKTEEGIYMPKTTCLFMDLNEAEDLRDYTVVYEIRLADIEGYIAMLQTNLANNNDCVLFVNRGKFGLGGDPGYRGTIEANKWHKLAYVVEDGIISLYVDGERIATSRDSKNDAWVINKEGVFFFLDNDGEHKPVEVGGIHFWKQTLSDQQIRRLDHGGSTPGNKEEPTETPTKDGEWLFDDSNDLYLCTKGNIKLTPYKVGGNNTAPTAFEEGEATGIEKTEEGIYMPKTTCLFMDLNEENDLRNYTLVYDLRLKDATSYTGLLQTNLQNSEDSKMFISKGKFGINASGFGYGGEIVANQWHRVTMAVEDGIISTYVDGEWIATSKDSGSDRWVIKKEGVFFFLDNDGESTDVEIAGIHFWKQTLSEGQIASLGGGESLSWYSLNFSKIIDAVRTDRMLQSITVADDKGGVQTIDVGVAKPYISKVNDEGSALTCKVGTPLTVSFDCLDPGLNGYVYIDLDDDKQFSFNDGQTDQSGTDVVTYSFYSGSFDDDSEGVNSAGEVLTGDSRKTTMCPTFTAPTEEGVYRIRFKTDWNSIDAGGQLAADSTCTGTNGFLANGGTIVDAVLYVFDSFTITYMVDGAVYHTEEVGYKDVINLPEPPTKEGYTFKEWEGLPETMPGKDITVTGVFTANNYQITYMLDGEVYHTDSVACGTKIPTVTPTKEGYTFCGWEGLPQTMPANDLIVEGSFVANKYKLTFVVDGEVYQSYSVAYGTKLTALEAPTKEGHTFSGWSELPETMPAGDVTVSGTFVINKYLVTFKIDGEVIASDSLEYGAAIIVPEVPEREGHTFSGWGKVAETVPARDLTYEAHFTINSYMIIYIVDGEEYKRETLTYGSAITPIDEPTKMDYNFSGWSEIPETMPAGDVIVTGSFIRTIYLTIQQADNGLVRLSMNEGTTTKFHIVAADGWRVNTVTFNGEDVSGQLEEGNIFTSPKIYEDAVLNISFEKIDDNIEQTTSRSISVSGHANTITIKGTAHGDIITIHTLDGAMVTNATATSETTSIKVPTQQVYIVKVAGKVVKIGM